MSLSSKFVVFGSSTREVEALLGFMSQAMKGSEVVHGDLAGSRVSRFSGHHKGENGSGGEFTVYGTSTKLDFGGIFKLLAENAAGVIGLIPADSARLEESRKILTSLHRALEARRKAEKDLPFVIQYHWPTQEVSPTPEELDEFLGINPQVVKRCYSRASGEQANSGVLALFEQLAVQVGA